MNASKDNIVRYISAAITRFSTEMSFWSKDQFTKLIPSSLGDDPEKISPAMMLDALKELESKKIIIFIGENDHYIALHPDYINRNLSDYVKASTLSQVSDILNMYKIRMP